MSMIGILGIGAGLAWLLSKGDTPDQEGIADPILDIDDDIINRMDSVSLAVLPV